MSNSSRQGNFLSIYLSQQESRELLKQKEEEIRSLKQQIEQYQGFKETERSTLQSKISALEKVIPEATIMTSVARTNGQPLFPHVLHNAGRTRQKAPQDETDSQMNNDGESMKLQMRLQTTENELHQEQRRVQLMYEENERYRQQIVELQRKAGSQDFEDANVEIINSQHCEIRQLRDDNAALKKNVESLEKSSSPAEYERQRREILELRKNNDELQVVIRQLTHELEERNQGITDLQRQVDMYRKLSQKKTPDSGSSESPGVMDRVLFECSRCRQVFREFPKFQVHITHCLEYRLFNASSRSERNLSSHSPTTPVFPPFNPPLGNEQPVTMRYSYDNLRSTTGSSHLRISALGKGFGPSANNSLSSSINFPSEGRSRTISTPHLYNEDSEPANMVKVTSSTSNILGSPEDNNRNNFERRHNTMPLYTVEKKDTPKMQSAEKLNISTPTPPASVTEESDEEINKQSPKQNLDERTSSNTEKFDESDKKSFLKSEIQVPTKVETKPIKRLEIPKIPPPPPPPVEEAIVAPDRPTSLNVTPPGVSVFAQHSKVFAQSAKKEPNSPRQFGGNDQNYPDTSIQQEPLKHHEINNIEPQSQDHHDAPDVGRRPLTERTKDPQGYPALNRYPKPILKSTSNSTIEPPSPILPNNNESIPGTEHYNFPSQNRGHLMNKPPSPIITGSPVPAQPVLKPAPPQIKSQLMPNSGLSAQYQALQGQQNINLPRPKERPPVPPEQPSINNKHLDNYYNNMETHSTNHDQINSYMLSQPSVKQQEHSQIQFGSKGELRKWEESQNQDQGAEVSRNLQIPKSPDSRNEFQAQPNLSREFQQSKHVGSHLNSPLGLNDQTNQFQRVAESDSQVQVSPRVPDQFQHPPHQDNQGHQPRGPHNQFQGTSTPESPFERPTGLHEHIQTPPGPDNLLQRRPGSDNLPQRPPSPDSHFQRPPGPQSHFQKPTGPDSNFERPPGPESHFHRPLGPDSHFQRPPGPNSHFQRPPGPDSHFQRPPGPDSNFQKPPGLDSHFQRPPGPDSNFQRPHGPDSNFQKPPGPDSHFQKPDGSDSHFQRPPGQDSHFQRPPGPDGFQGPPSHDSPFQRPPISNYESQRRSGPESQFQRPTEQGPRGGPPIGVLQMQSPPQQGFPQHLKSQPSKEDKKQTKGNILKNPFSRKNSKEREKKEKPLKPQPMKPTQLPANFEPIKPVATSTADRSNKAQHMKQQEMHESLNASFSSINGGGYYRRAPRPRSMPPPQNRVPMPTVMTDV